MSGMCKKLLCKDSVEGKRSRWLIAVIGREASRLILGGRLAG